MDKPKLHHAQAIITFTPDFFQFWAFCTHLPTVNRAAFVICFCFSFCCSTMQSKKVNIAIAQEVEDSTEAMNLSLWGKCEQVVW